MIQRTEVEGIKLLDDQVPEFKDRLEKHWASYPVEWSAVRRALLAMRCLRSPGEPPCNKTENEFWYNIYMTRHKEKNLEWLRRTITSFQNRVTMKQSTTGKKVKLGTQSVGSFRDVEPSLVHKLACVFYDTRPRITGKFGTQKEEQIHDQFYRGLLDKQPLEKVKAMDPAAQLGDFTFLITETDQVVIQVEKATA